MKYVVVVTGEQDPMWPFLLDACSEEQRRWIVLYATDNPAMCQLTYGPVSEEVHLRIGNRAMQGSMVGGIWWRRLVPPDTPRFSKELQLYCEKEIVSFLEGLEHLISNAVWVSLPSAISRARCKAYQLRQAREVGFLVPETVFTNSPADLKRFCGGRETVYKSIRSPRVPAYPDKHSTVFTTILRDEHFVMADSISECPGTLQRFVEKKSDIRVTVFGDRLFAVEIDSQNSESSKVDFRFGARYLSHRVYALPREIADRCIQIVAKLGLKFGAIDLALMRDDTYVFFEINPNGQWGWLEEKTGLPMRKALLDLLFQGGGVRSS